MKFLISLVLMIARWCLAAVFISASLSKIMFFDQTSELMAAKGFTFVPLFLFGAAVIELVGGASLVVGYKTRLGASILILFLIPTTIIFHDFWNVVGDDQMLQLAMFFKNLAIFGGLLYIVCEGAGLFAIDAWCSCKGKVQVVNQPPLSKEPPTLINE